MCKKGNQLLKCQLKHLKYSKIIGDWIQHVLKGTLIKDTVTASISNTENNVECSFPGRCFTCFGIVSTFVCFSSFYLHCGKKNKINKIF